MDVDFGAFWGNEGVKGTLAHKIRTRSAAHAYLLEGPPGSGKSTLAHILSAALCCENGDRVPCRQCVSCKKIFGDRSPDLYLLGREETGDEKKTKSIGVAAIRELQADAYIRPNDLERKLYIISHAERMTEQAQNALLKILEEPPETVIFFLLCEKKNALLSTVRSRVQTLTMERFTDDALYRLLTEHEGKAGTLAKQDPSHLRLLVRLANGAYGRALAYLSATRKELNADAAYDAHEGAVRCLACLFGEGAGSDSGPLGGSPRCSYTALSGVLATRCDTRDRLRGVLSALMEAVRDLTACKLQIETPFLFYTEPEQPTALSERCTLLELYRLHTRLTVHMASLDANPNVALVRGAVAEALLALRA